ncbi:MAG: hypothetical protein AAF585_09465, partial [Verrucomicrobiota bacterium]
MPESESSATDMTETEDAATQTAKAEEAAASIGGKALSTVVGGVIQLYSAIQTAKFRAQVLKGITRLETGQGQILNVLNALEEDEKWGRLVDHLSPCIDGRNGILTIYTDAQMQPIPNPKELDDRIIDNVVSSLTVLNSSIMGEHDDPLFTQSLLEAYIDYESAQARPASSVCEMAYQFVQSFVGIQMKALILLNRLAPYDKKNDTHYHKTAINWCTTKIPNQLKKCQKILDNLNPRLGGNLWFGMTQSNSSSYYL